MRVMKTSLTIFPCVLGSAFPIIRVCPGLSFATKRIGPPCCTLFTFCLLLFILSRNYLLPTISVLAEKTLLKTAYHFLLLLVGFDTLTYRKRWRSGNGGPQTCLPAAHSVAKHKAVRPIFVNKATKTLARGQASRGGQRGASSGTASSGWLTRRRRDQGGVPHELPVTQAMTTQGASRVPARAVSSLPLWCKGGKCSRGVPRHQAKVAISVQ